jgi:hypothetical protein
MGILYRQCLLKKGTEQTTTWIPSKYAVKNKFVMLKNNGKWIDGWQVVQVGKIELEEDYLVDRSMDYTRTRKASDI